MDNLTQKRALTIAEAAKYSCYSRGTIEGWIARGLLPVEQPPGRGTGEHKLRRIRLADLNAFLDQYYQQPEEKNIASSKAQGITLVPRERNHRKRILEI